MLRLIFLMSLLLLVWCNSNSVGCSQEEEDFNPRVVVKRKFPTIKVVDIQSREGADKVLKDEELVLAVEVNGKPRAYAINMLTGPTREIINDNLGDRAIAATW